MREAEGSRGPFAPGEKFCTRPYDVAGAGGAIWCFLQGQNLKVRHCPPSFIPVRLSRPFSSQLSSHLLLPYHFPTPSLVFPSLILPLFLLPSLFLLLSPFSFLFPFPLVQLGGLWERSKLLQRGPEGDPRPPIHFLTIFTTENISDDN